MSINIIVNPGSSSRKYAAYDSESKLLHKVNYEEVDQLGFFANSFSKFITELKDKNINLKEVDLNIGIRLVAPGTYFQENKIIDDKFIIELSKVMIFDQAHIDVTLTEISQIKKLYKNVKIYAISDSAIFDNEKFNREFSLESDIAEKYDIYKFGYHGISVGSIINLLKKESILKENMIICHLGSGSSVTAVQSGNPVYNSFGYAPCDGMITSTRASDMTSGAVLKLISEGLSAREVLNILYNDGGLKSISRLSKDMKTLIDDYDVNQNAKKAIDRYVLDIAEKISTAALRLGGVGQIVFTGTIGYRSEFIRNKILDNLKIFNLDKIEIIVKETEEEREMNSLLIRLCAH